MKGRLSHNHQLLSSFCQLISFPHCDTQSIDAHLSNFENLPQKWNLSSWRLIILLLSKESKVVTFTRNCLQTPSHMLKLQAMHSPLDSCGRTPLSGVTFTLSQRLKSSQNKIFFCRKMKNPHTLSLHSVSTASFLYLNWHIHKADVVHGLQIKLWNPFFSQSHAEHSCNWVTSWFVDSNFIFRF